MKTLSSLALLTCALMAATPIMAGDPPVELGAVRWGRDLSAAQHQSATSGKPILVLFQEVPG